MISAIRHILLTDSKGSTNAAVTTDGCYIVCQVYRRKAQRCDARAGEQGTALGVLPDSNNFLSLHEKQKIPQTALYGLFLGETKINRHGKGTTIF